MSKLKLKHQINFSEIYVAQCNKNSFLQILSRSSLNTNYNLSTQDDNFVSLLRVYPICKALSKAVISPVNFLILRKFLNI